MCIGASTTLVSRVLAITVRTGRLGGGDWAQAGAARISVARAATVEKGVPRPAMHYRSGAALYYVLAGNWTIHMDGKSEQRSRGNVQLEPHGFVHTWEIVGDVTGVLLQANISPEATPEIIFLQPR